MTFSGRIFVHNDGRVFRIIADNRGESPGSLTHVLFNNEETARTQHAYQKGKWVSHDDVEYGHHHRVPSSGTCSMTLPIGETYVRGRGGGSGEVERIEIQPGAFLRVGFRDRAWAVTELPKPGTAVEIPYESLTPNVASYREPLGWEVMPMQEEGAGASNEVRNALAVLDQFEHKHVVKGRVVVTSVFSDIEPKAHLGWNVEFFNEGAAAQENQTTGFTGTVVLLNEKGEGAKNAGLGLEAMPCPDRDYSARQFIARGGDYGRSQFGITAEPGVSIRLGVRGRSNILATLPAADAAPVEINLDSFTVESNKSLPEYFESDTLLMKMGEKKAHVTFKRGGRELNAEIPDSIYTGEEALIRAEFKEPPGVRVIATDTAYRIELESRLPAQDDLGPIAFVARLTIENAGGVKPEHRIFFNDHSRTATIEVQKKSVDAPNGFEPGDILEIDTGPLGWRGRVPLPSSGTVSTHTSQSEMLQHWVLRETDYKRAGLLPEAARQRLA